ncbi:MAG: DUF6785 family protein, partial [Candidatus Bathyarchaeia archaeon]
DIEKMDFVWATVYTTTILNLAPREAERSSVRFFVLRKRFLVALIIGAAFELQMALNIMYPWFPSVTASYLKWPFVSWHPGTLDFGVAIGMPWFEGLPGWTGIIFSHPVGFAVAFLMPLEVLLTAGIFTFIQGSLIPMILSFMGMVPKPAFPGGGSRYGYNAWYYGSALGPGNPYLGNVLSDLGFWVGLGFFPLIMGGNWRYIVDTLRSARRGPSTEEREREPMPYRWAWTLFAVCFVLFLVWGYVGLGLGLAAGIIWLVYWTFTQLGFVRMKAAGYVNRELVDDWIGIVFYSRMLYPPFMNLPGTFADLNAIYPNPDAVSYYGMRHLFSIKGFLWGNTDMYAAHTFMETYKVGANLGVKPRDMFKAVTLATVIVISVALPAGLWYYYTFGIKPEGIAYEWSLGGSGAGAWTIPGFMWVGLPQDVGWKVGLTGLLSFLVMGALVWLRSHFIWFPLSPVGAVIGVQIASVIIGWGYTYLVTYFLKRLAFRVGGVKLYEDWIVPVAVGFIVGYALGVLLWGVASIARFLYV